jgi:hypothetical protein
VLSKVSLRTPRADVREVGLDEGASEGAAPRAARVKLKRTLDGWKRETGTGEAGVSEREAAGLGALLTMLCEARASGAMLAGPPGVRAVGTVTILRDGVVQESAEVSVATVPLASGPAEAIVVKVGSVWRVYPAAAHAAAAECLRIMLPTEG